MITHLALVLAEETVATIICPDLALQASVLDKLHHLYKLRVGKPQIGVVGGASRRKHRKQPPTTDSQRNQEVAELGQVFDGTLIDTGDDIPSEARALCHGLHGAQHVLITHGVAAHPVVVFFEAVEADRQGFQSSFYKLVEFFGRKEHSVAHHTPHKTAFGDFLATMRQIVAHGRFAARGDNHHLTRVLMGTHLVKYLGKILKGHVIFLRKHTAVGAAMSAVEIAAQGAFPKQLVKFMLVNALFQNSTIDFEHDFLVKTKTVTHNLLMAKRFKVVDYRKEFPLCLD